MDIRFLGGDEEAGEVFIVETKVPAGHAIGTHRHDHAHTSVLVSGSARVVVDGTAKEFSGYNLITIPAGSTHEVHALTDVVWLCLWAGDKAPREKAEQAVKIVEAFNAQD